MPTDEQLNRYHQLEYNLADVDSGVIAVSGGLDSRLLAFTAARLDLDVHCVHIRGPHVPAHETADALLWLKGLGLPFSVVEIDPLADPVVAANPRDRCYHCKRHLFMELRRRFPDRVLMDGTNATDLGQYRPGLRALAELTVYSPFAECGISKEDIRALAEHVGLDRPRQAAMPCLLTRLPYDTQVRAADLARIDALEGACRAAGFVEFRVRLVDGEPVLFVKGQDQGLAAPKGLRIEFTDDLSGYWDRQP